MAENVTKAASAVYQLWEGGNAIGGFETQDEALVIVRETLEQCGPEDVLELSLWLLSGDRKLTLIADGETLLKKARLIPA
jgi:hypothetical protein